MTNDRISIGALTTLGELERHAELRASSAPLSVMAASRVATPQIRNVGTIGGNLLQDSRCPYYRGPWYCYRAGGIQCDARHGVNQEHAIFGGNRCYTVSPSDTAPALIALGARPPFAAPRRARCPVEDLFMPPGDNITVMHRLAHGTVLVHITVPIRSGTRSTFIKYAMRTLVGLRPRQRRRRPAGWTAALARDVRIVLGGVAPIPWRSVDAEREIEGKATRSTTIESAAQPQARPRRDVRSRPTSALTRRDGQGRRW